MRFAESKIKELKARALQLAAKSPCKKRKVGAIVVDYYGDIIGEGYNCNDNMPCEDAEGKTLGTVVHAEVLAIQDYINAYGKDKGVAPYAIFVTHQPCDNCQKAIDTIGIKEVHIVENFMKFDGGKLRYSLIPTTATKALAQVLTYGAKKYKPNNWQQVDDISRYLDALYRHLEAYRSGELVDEESGLSHLAHALTNVAFLHYFETNK